MGAGKKLEKKSPAKNKISFDSNLPKDKSNS
jgi:hypothetical protein